MKLENYLLKNKGKLNDLQQKFLLNVFYPDFGEEGLDLIEPEVEIDKPDGTGVYKIDFVISTSFRKYAIECDGLYYHASGAVTKDYFKHLQEKQNEIIDQGYKLIRFTNDAIRKNPDECIWEIRRNCIADKQLYSLYLNRIGEIKPHGVQEEVLERLAQNRKEGKTKGLVVLATGLGKTYLAALDLKNFNPDKALFIVHINEILKQAIKSFQEVIPEKLGDMGFYNGKVKDKKDILFASIQTLSRQHNLDKFKEDEFDYIIVDETHHTAAKTYQKIFSHFKPKFILGLTATPERMDGLDILQYYDENIVFSMDQKEAIEKGFLAPFHYYGFKDDVNYENIKFNGFRYDVEDLNRLLLIEKRDEAVIEKFKEMAGDRKTIAFCASIEHANWSATLFNKHGIESIAIHSKLDYSDKLFDEKKRDNNIDDFRDGKYQVAFVVNMFNEGIDIPDVSCLLFLRPTESKTIFIQHMGRGLRLSPEKENVLILDFIGNYRTAGLILSGLGLNKGTGDLEFVKSREGKKEIYYYENNGCEVNFDVEVVDIFKKLEAQQSKKVRHELLEDEWREYGEYLKENTATGSKMHWKVGNKNDHLDVHFWALDYIDKNATEQTATDLSNNIRTISKRKFPGRTMEGSRALFLSKLLGFLKDSTPLKTTKVYNEIKSRESDFFHLENFSDIITRQLEKFYFWNDIFSLVDRHVDKKSRMQINEYFGIYPLIFIYEVIIKLREDYGYDESSLTKFEVDYFLALARSHMDLDEIVERIIKFREHEERYELEKYLKKQSSMDARFFKILRYCIYFDYSNKKITLKEDFYKEVFDKVKIFRRLLEENKLIKFDGENPSEYRKMLCSSKSLIDYHNSLG